VGIFADLLAHFHRTLTLANWLGWTFDLGVGLCAFVVLLFPAGTLPSRRWRPVACAAGAGLAGWALGNTFAPTIISASPPMPNPAGVTGPAGDIFNIMANGGRVLMVAAGLAAVLSLVFRYRRARTAERAQLKWLVYAGAVVVAAALIAAGPVEQIMSPGDAATNLQNAMVSGAIALIAVAIGIAVLRYRLYDIDRVISRTVAYTISPACWPGLRRAGTAGHPRVRLAHAGGGGRRHAGRGGALQSPAPAGAAIGGPAVQPGPV
jgi:hypothetical protein